MSAIEYTQEQIIANAQLVSVEPNMTQAKEKAAT